MLVTANFDTEKFCAEMAGGGIYISGRAAVDREFADFWYISVEFFLLLPFLFLLARCFGDGKQKRAPTLMRASAKIL